MMTKSVETVVSSGRGCKPGAAAPILLSSPLSSGNRVSFDLHPRVEKISYNNGVPVAVKSTKFEIKDKTLVLHISMRDNVKAKAKKYSSMAQNKDTIVLRYKRRGDIDVDLRALGLRSKTYMENKVIVNGLGYKETEESVKEYFSQFGEVEKVALEKTAKNLCNGKATVTFENSINTNRQFRLNGRLLRIERIKKQMLNTTRLHISHMKNTVNISKLRAALKTIKLVPKNIRIDLVDGKNKGYGFVEFATFEETELLMQRFETLRHLIGPNSFVEYSKEKIIK